MNKITLLMHCKDWYGIIASITNFIDQHSGNIIYINQN